MKAMRRLIRAGFLALAAVPLLVLFGGCGGTPAEDCTRYQDPHDRYDRSGAGDTLPLTIVAVDLFTNEDGFAKVVEDAVQPVLKGALEHGAYVELVGDGGTGTEVAHSGCFRGVDAPKPFLIRSYSQAHDRDDWVTKSAELAGEVREFVRSLRVAERGSLARLAVSVAQQTRDARASRYTGPIDVIFVTNLLGNAGDCLDVNGATATPTAAKEIATRCFDTGQLARMPEATSVRFVGLDYGQTTLARKLLATHLATELEPRFEQTTR
jgi:hypothetical protein